jgi:hypothetical protein
MINLTEKRFNLLDDVEEGHWKKIKVFNLGTLSDYGFKLQL